MFQTVFYFIPSKKMEEYEKRKELNLTLSISSFLIRIQFGIEIFNTFISIISKQLYSFILFKMINSANQIN